MHLSRTRSLYVSFAAMSLLSGCEGHARKVAALNDQYKAAQQRFQKDCSAESAQPFSRYSPKCASEKKERDEALDRLQDEQIQR